MKDDDLDCLEAMNTLSDSIDILEATEPTGAIIEVITEEVVMEPLRDILERL